MTGPFIALGAYAWFEGIEEHRTIFLQYFQQLFPLGVALTLGALILGFVVLNRLFNTYVTGIAATT
ncbi:MAG: hypothetical protein B7X60_16465 [Polynucleobacter sp. 39-45-136]|nr:MAG: hypothetical protein B7X60_16465 [Polynucleobacter sp. 39-45-136]